MNETKKRGWIKNVIIIFLCIMLLLTLFSNTIMNRSLPEVSVSNSEGGTISSQIKLNGTVSANQTKQITLEEARTIDTVNVRRGDTIARGDVLATLVKGESADVYEKEIELRQLEIAYKKMLLSEGDSLVTYRRTIEDSKKELEEIEAYLAEYPMLEDAVKNCEAQIAVLENDIDTVEKKIKELENAKKALEKQQKEYSSGGYSTLKELNEAIKDRNKALEDLDDAVSDAKKERSAALSARTVAQNALDAYNSAVKEKSELEAAIDKINESITEKKAEKKELKNQLDELKASENADELQSDIAALEEKISVAEKEIDGFEDELDSKKDALSAVTKSLDNMKSLDELESDLAIKKSAYTAADKAYKAAKDAVSDAEDALDKLSEDGIKYFTLQSQIDEYDTRIEEQNETKAEVEEQLDEAKEQLGDAQKEIEKTPKECDGEKLTLTRAIEDAENAIAIAEANGAIEDEAFAMELAMKKSEIERKKKEIAKLKSELSETEITSPVSGTISSVGIAAGDETEANTVAFEITMTEMGYTMECSVTNSQAARLKVGEVAEVQYYYWGAKPSVRITQIATDPQSGGKNKLVTFTVEGDVSEGTSLSLVIGSQGSSYDTIVPNSAIREDANGKFILKVVSKSSATATTRSALTLRCSRPTRQRAQ